MANIFDYLDWRSDVSFEEDPFNEVDNLVLAQLAYTDFDGCVPTGDEESVNIRAIYEKYYSIHTREEIEARTSFIAKAPFLMDGMVDSKRFGNIQFKGYVNQINESKDEQMSAIQMWLPDGTVYVAYRGTDDTFVGWKEDLNFSYMRETEGQKKALQYLNDHFKGKDVKLRVGGHSKGGNFAVYASAFCDASIQDHILEVWSNDGPGFLHEVTELSQFISIQPKIKAIVPESSIIGMLMYSLGTKQVIKSDGKGFMQHDANTWQLMRNRFIQCESRDNESILADKTIRSWLHGLNEEERQTFINAVFEILEASGETTVSGFNKSLIKNVPALIKAIGTLSEEQQANVKKVVLKLSKSYIAESANSFTESVKKSTENLMKEFTSF